MAEKVTLKIPRPLYERIQKLIEGSGFSSPTDFIVFVLRDLVYLGAPAVRAREAVAGGEDRDVARRAEPPGAATGEDRTEFTGEELRALRDKLRELGYL
jgi:hypothetical protein